MKHRIVLLISIWIASSVANADRIPCSLEKFSTEVDKRVEAGLSLEGVRKILTESYQIQPSEINHHVYETPATLNTRKGEVAGVASRFNVILKRCRPVSAFFFETWFSGHYYFNDQGQLIVDEYFYTVDAL
tara:strand:+ start:83 stop:475 length:393 start_codon:yes stop_codon:yes gene_type:complete